MHIWTDTPRNEIWQQLRYFKSSANVRQLLLGNTVSRRLRRWPAEKALERAPEIASCVEQADEYFRAAVTVSLATKPLLQFYGVECLAKAIVMLSDENSTLQNLKYHGLSTRAATAGVCGDELQAYADSPSSWCVENEFAVTNEGVFPALARVTGDGVISPRVVIRLKDMFAKIPELSEAFSRHYGEASDCVRIYARPRKPDSESDNFEVYFDVKDHDSVLAVFPEFRDGFEQSARHEYPGFKSATSVAPKFGKPISHSVAGEFFVRPHQSGVVTSSAVLFAASFIISNLVRYKPAFWMKVLQGADTGAAGIVEMLCNVIDRRFPQNALESIWSERFTFGGPAYLA